MLAARIPIGTTQIRSPIDFGNVAVSWALSVKVGRHEGLVLVIFLITHFMPSAKLTYFLLNSKYAIKTCSANEF